MLDVGSQCLSAPQCRFQLIMPDAPSPVVAPQEKQLCGVVISKTGIPQKAVPGTMAPHHGPTVPAVYKVPPGYPKEPTLVPKAETQPPPNVKAKAAAQAPPAAQAAVPKAGPPPVNQSASARVPTFNPNLPPPSVPEEEPAWWFLLSQAREDGTRLQHHPKLPVDLRYKWSLLSQQSWDLLFPGLDGIIPNDHEVEGPQPVHLALLQLPIHLVLPAVYSRGEYIASQLVDDYPRLQFFNPQVAWTEFIEGPNSSMRKEPDWTYCALHAKLSLYLKPRRALEFWVANGHLGLDEQGTHFFVHTLKTKF